MLIGDLELEIDVNAEEGFNLLMTLFYNTELFIEDRNDKLYRDIARSIDPNSIYGLRTTRQYDLDLDLNKYVQQANGLKAEVFLLLDHLAGYIDLSTKDIFEDRMYFVEFMKSGLVADTQLAVEFAAHMSKFDVDKFIADAEREGFVGEDCVRKGYKEVAEYLTLVATILPIDKFVNEMINKYPDSQPDWQCYGDWNFIEMLKELKSKANVTLRLPQLQKLADLAMLSDTGRNAALLLTSGLLEKDSKIFNELYLFIYERALPAIALGKPDSHLRWLNRVDAYSAGLPEISSLEDLNREFGM